MKPILTRWAFIMANNIIDPLYYDLVFRENVLGIIQESLTQSFDSWNNLANDLNFQAERNQKLLDKLSSKYTEMQALLGTIEYTHSECIKLLNEIQTERLKP